MSLEYNFSIEEQPDGKSFIFKDTTGNYDVVTNTGGWGTPNVEPILVGDYYVIRIDFRKYLDNGLTESNPPYFSKSFTTVQYPIATLLDTGAEIYFNDEQADTFDDAAYKVTVTIESEQFLDSVSIDYGFFALEEVRCMNNFLTYNPFLPRKDKEIFWEKSRLLDNLYYAAETDQILHFKENLDAIIRLR